MITKPGLAFAVSLGYAEYHRRYSSYLEVPVFDAHTHLVGGKLSARGMTDVLILPIVAMRLLDLGLRAV